MTPLCLTICASDIFPPKASPSRKLSNVWAFKSKCWTLLPLAFSNLARFDAIVVGVRGYELRPELAGTNQRLLDYVSNGGTLVVQYQRDFAWDKFQYAPYPAKISPEKPNSPLPRITDEASPVKFLK